MTCRHGRRIYLARHSGTHFALSVVATELRAALKFPTTLGVHVASLPSSQPFRESF